jgi:hypothetical protein
VGRTRHSREARAESVRRWGPLSSLTQGNYTEKSPAHLLGWSGHGSATETKSPRESSKQKRTAWARLRQEAPLPHPPARPTRMLSCSLSSSPAVGQVVEEGEGPASPQWEEPKSGTNHCTASLEGDAQSTTTWLGGEVCVAQP